MSYEPLLDALDAAAGPDIELDLAIAISLTGWCEHKNLKDTGCQSDTGFTCRDCGADSWGNTGPTKQKLHAKLPAYTASLEAIFGLAEKLAPHGRLMVERDHGGDGWAMVQLTVNSMRSMAFGKTPAIALCAALLDALQTAGSATPALPEGK